MKNVFMVFFLLLVVGCDLTSSSKKNVIKKKNITAIALTDLSGEKVFLKDYKEKRILLNFWATWCGPCKNEMPDLLRAQEILAKENYVFLFVSDESIAKINEFKQQSKYKFNYFVSNTSMSSLGVYSLPTTYIYNEKGEMVDKVIGVVKWDSDKMISKLKAVK